MGASNLSALDEDFLLEVLSTPTAPFREGCVRAVIEAYLDRHHTPHFTDPCGNLVVGAPDRRGYEAITRQAARAKRPLLIFLAHLDHPGFHGVRWKSPHELEVRWLGGTPTQNVEGARGWVVFRDDPERRKWAGTHHQPVLKEGPRRSLASSTFRFAISPELAWKPESAYGGFRFREPVWREGPLYLTQAADDLVGAVCAAQTLVGLRGKNPRPPTLAVLTRGEEVGFVGAVAHLRLGWTRKSNPPVIVSLETSRTLPNAEIGKGPVVRLGDRMNPFSPGPTHLLTEIAKKTLPDRHQRRIMDGGSCEASAALLHGFEAVGISVPLGNYHNQGLEGGPDATPGGGPSPEFVHAEDIRGMLALCQALARSRAADWEDPFRRARENLFKEHRQYRGELRTR